MQYTTFGKSGVTVSRLGFGCMRLPLAPDGKVDQEEAIAVLRRAVDLGVNYFDTAYFYHDGESEVTLGKAMKGLRDRVIIATKSPGHLQKEPGDYRRVLEEQLTRLGMDTIDFYHFHGINPNRFRELDEKTGWYKAALQAKEEGLIRHICFSFHSGNSAPDGPSLDLMELVDTGYFESVLCQYNALDQSNAKGMAYAKEKGLGVAAMGPVGGGRISGMPQDTAEKLGISVAASAELALRYVASNPNVDILLSGMSSMRQLEENVEYVSRMEPLSEAEIAGIHAMMRENRRIADLYCTGCRYCLPCPQDVNIPHIFQAVNYYRVYNTTEYAREMYAGIGKGWIPGKRADVCNECGACEEKCPQNIRIREQLKEARALLSDQ